MHFLDERGSDGAVVEVGVHIADVSYFVRPGTLLDYEARLRGTTVYLVDRRLDMLPSLLSENLASLLQRRDRLAVSCVWRLDEKMDVVDVWFGRSVIHSRHQMTYYQAQAIHDEKPLPLSVCPLPALQASIWLALIWGLAVILIIILPIVDRPCDDDEPKPCK